MGRIDKIFKLFFNKTFTIALLIGLVSFILRFYKLKERFDWTGVEGSFIWDIWYVAKGHPSLIGFEAAAVGHLNFPPFLLWFLTPFFILAKGNPIYIEIILVLLGALSSALLFLIGKKIFGFPVGLIASLIYAFSLHAMIVDRKFVGGTFIIPVTLITLLLLWQIIQDKKLKISRLVILGSLVGLAFSAHYQTIFIVLSLLIFFLLCKREFLQPRPLIIFLFFIAIWLSPLILFDLRHNFYTLNGLLIVLTKYTNPNTQAGFPLSLQYLVQNTTAFFNHPLYFLPFGKISFGLLLVLTLATLALIFWILRRSCFSQNQEKIVNFCFVLIAVGSISLGFYRSADYNFDYYFWYQIPAYIFLFALTIRQLARLRFLQPLLFLLLAIFLYLNLTSFSSYEPFDSYTEIKNTTIALLEDAQKKNLKEVVVKFEKAEVGAFDYLFYYLAPKFNFTSDSLTLISTREHYQERSILGSGKSPIKILPKGAGKTILGNYVISRSGTSRFILRVI